MLSPSHQCSRLSPPLTRQSKTRDVTHICPTNACLFSQLIHFHCYCSVAQSCPTLCDPMDCSTPGFLVLHHFPGLAQTHVHWVGDAIQPSCPLVVLFSFCLLSSPAWGSFQMSWLFASGGQSTGASTSASALPMKIQGLFPLGLTGLVSLHFHWASIIFQALWTWGWIRHNVCPLGIYILMSKRQENGNWM